jgi:NAD(P)-dependent dehydrogenase (short-subunit alcohol dehydrogenase family)
MLEGKVALVTGAGRGIGREIALSMARSGAAVVVNDVGASVTGSDADAAPANEVVGIIRSEGGRAVASFDSVAEPEAAARIVAAAIAEFGQLDIVVNNAGILRDVIFHKMGFDDWDAVLKVHLYGSYNVSRAAAEHFRARQAGAFIHMSSTSGLIGNPGQSNYAAAKMGIVGLSRGLALDMQRFNVRSNCIVPFAFSRMVDAIKVAPEMEARFEAARAKMVPEKIAPLATFLASDAARDVSGQIIAVRGNEIFVMSQPRPVRSTHRSEGWTPETIADHALPALRSALVPLETARDVFNWDPV